MRNIVKTTIVTLALSMAAIGSAAAAANDDASGDPRIDAPWGKERVVIYNSPAPAIVYHNGVAVPAPTTTYPNGTVVYQPSAPVVQQGSTVTYPDGSTVYYPPR